MKFLILVVSCALFALREASGQKIELPQDIIELLTRLGKLCQEETKISDSMVDDMRKGKFSEDPDGKCYLKCIMRHTLVMKEDGSLDLDLIEATMPEVLKTHGGMESTIKCKDKKGDNICDTAYNILTCMQKENPHLADMFE